VRNLLRAARRCARNLSTDLRLWRDLRVARAAIERARCQQEFSVAHERYLELLALRAERIDRAEGMV